MIAVLFPGQGQRLPLPGLEHALSHRRGRALVDRAAHAAGLTVEDVLAKGQRALERTEVLQPVLTAVTLSIWEAARADGLSPSVVMGHSLGEIAAWSASGAITAEESVELAAIRGRLMAREAAANPGGMVAVAGISVLPPGVTIGAVNAPDEIILTGENAALRAVPHARRLPVAGAWHSPLMRGAAADFAAALDAVSISHSTITLVQGGTGEVDAPMAPHLVRQLTETNRFMDALATLKTLGVTEIVTCGPGAVLRSLVARNLGTTIPVREAA